MGRLPASTAAPGLRFPPTTGHNGNGRGAMRGLDEEQTWDFVAMGSAALAAITARAVMRGGWKLVRRSEPPENPAARSVDWREAVAWTVVTGIVVGLMRLFAERGAAAGWRTLRGRYPKGLE